MHDYTSFWELIWPKIQATLDLTKLTKKTKKTFLKTYYFVVYRKNKPCGFGMHCFNHIKVSTL